MTDLALEVQDLIHASDVREWKEQLRTLRHRMNRWARRPTPIATKVVERIVPYDVSHLKKDTASQRIIRNRTIDRLRSKRSLHFIILDPGVRRQQRAKGAYDESSDDEGVDVSGEAQAAMTQSMNPSAYNREGEGGSRQPVPVRSPSRVLMERSPGSIITGPVTPPISNDLVQPINTGVPVTPIALTLDETRCIIVDNTIIRIKSTPIRTSRLATDDPVTETINTTNDDDDPVGNVNTSIIDLTASSTGTLDNDLVTDDNAQNTYFSNAVLSINMKTENWCELMTDYILEQALIRCWILMIEPTEETMTRDWLNSIDPDEATEWATVIAGDAISNFSQHFLYVNPPTNSTPIHDSVSAAVPVTEGEYEEGMILDLSDTNTVKSTTTSMSRPASPEIEQTPGFLERMNQSAANVISPHLPVHPISSGESDIDDCQVVEPPVSKKSRKLSEPPVTRSE